MKDALKIICIFFIGCFTYGLMEITARGHTHISMGLVGGLSMLFISLINGITSGKSGLLLTVIMSSVFITVLELITGEIVNLYLGLRVWSYETVPLNYKGQICLPFSLLWIVISFVGVILDNLASKYIFCEDNPSKTLTFSNNLI